MLHIHVKYTNKQSLDRKGVGTALTLKNHWLG